MGKKIQSFPAICISLRGASISGTPLFVRELLGSSRRVPPNGFRQSTATQLNVNELGKQFLITCLDTTRPSYRFDADAKLN